MGSNSASMHSQRNTNSQPIPRHRSATITSNNKQVLQQQPELQELDLLQLIDPAVNAASTLTHIRNSLFVPPMLNQNFATPSIQLEDEEEEEEEEDDEEGNQRLSSVCPSIHTQSPSQLRRQKIKRLAQGVRAFIITPIGIIMSIYAILVVFWGAALVLILLGWLKITPQEKYRLWIEICSQVLNGLFTIPGIGLFPSRMIDAWNIAIIVYYARVICKRQGRKNLDDPNDLIPPQPSKTDLNQPKQREKPVQEGEEPGNNHNNEEEEDIHEAHAEETDDLDDSSGLIDVWKDDQEIVLHENEIDRLRTAQEKLCRSQTWYRPHSSATHYAFPICWAVVIMLLNIGNSLFQAALCAVMWGLRYDTRPAWTTATFMVCSFSCGIASGLLIWRIGLRTLKTKQVVREQIC